MGGSGLYLPAVSLAVLVSFVGMLLPVLVHASQFAWQQLLSPPEVAPFFASVGLLWIVVVGILVRYGPATLSHAPAATLPAALSRRIASEHRALNLGDAV